MTQTLQEAEASVRDRGLGLALVAPGGRVLAPYVDPDEYPDAVVTMAEYPGGPSLFGAAVDGPDLGPGHTVHVHAGVLETNPHFLEYGHPLYRTFDT